MRLILTLIILPIFLINIYSQPCAKGFKYIDNGEFDKAIEWFSKKLKDDPKSSVLNLGLAMLYSIDEYSGHDYFKSWDYIVESNKNFNNISDEDGTFLKNYFGSIDSHRRNRTNKYNYDLELKIIEDKLIKYVREENNVDLAEKYIKNYPNSKYYENVIHIRNHIKFRTAEKTNTLEAYQTFIKTYPDAAQIPKALKACSILAYEEALKINTLESYNTYLKEWPNSEKYIDVIKKRDENEFQNAKNLNTIEAVGNFISNYPNASQVMNARTILKQLIYKKAKQINTVESYNEFISKYPEGEYFVDIFNLKAIALGKKISENIEGNKEAIEWIKGFDFEETNDFAGGILEETDGNVIIAGTRQRSGEDGSQSWIISIDNTGKVLWNKAFGSQRFNNSNKLQSFTDGTLLVTGWSGPIEDTEYRKSWILKVSKTGIGIWEKNLEGNEIKDLIKNTDNGYYFCGYQIDDSLKERAFIEKINPDFKKLWSRRYAHQGTISSLSLHADNELICSTGNWVFKLSPQGYILWEKILPITDSIFLSKEYNNQLYLIGLRNHFPIISKYSLTGNFLSEILPDINNSSIPVICHPISGNRLIIITNIANGLVIKILDEKGLELKVLSIKYCQIPGPNSMFVSESGEVYLTVNYKNENNSYDIGVIKLLF